LDELSQARDERSLAKAYMLSFWRQWAANQATLAAEAVKQAAEHAARAGDEALRARALDWYVASLIWGPLHVSAIAAEVSRLQAERPGPYLAATLDIGRSEVARLDGDFDLARELAQRAYDGFLALGMRPAAAGSALSQARIELSAGDPGRARAILDRCDAVLAEFDERPQRSTIRAMLAHACELLGESDEARRSVAMSEELSASDDAINFAMTHTVRARLALAEGDGEEAERWARSAIRHALRTDLLGLHADTRLVLAGVLSGLGRESEAAEEARAAMEAFNRKGDRAGQQAA